MSNVCHQRRVVARVVIMYHINVSDVSDSRDVCHQYLIVSSFRILSDVRNVRVTRNVSLVRHIHHCPDVSFRLACNVKDVWNDRVSTSPVGAEEDQLMIIHQLTHSLQTTTFCPFTALLFHPCTRTCLAKKRKKCEWGASGRATYFTAGLIPRLEPFLSSDGDGHEGVVQNLYSPEQSGFKNHCHWQMPTKEKKTITTDRIFCGSSHCSQRMEEDVTIYWMWLWFLNETEVLKIRI